jgi:NAD(P)-dependent dehydrogenase (short-subunit alcohol dehydrogenase family)
MSDLKDKVVLITGGSGGLGRVLAEAFARAGSGVVIAARSEDKLKVAAEKISGTNRPVLAMRCDVADKRQVEALDKTIRAEAGAVQILINSAGIARAMSFLDMPESLWHETLQTNLTGVYNCCRVFLPGMLADGWGRIINIASTTGKVGYSHVAAYSASKHGVLGLTRSLAVEFARRNITVNAICPGYLNDELTHQNARRMAQSTGKSADDVLALFAASAPQKRLIEPEEVAALALLLAGEESAGITGQAINIDGGAVMV